MPRPSHLRLAFSLATRIACVGFTLVAAFAIPEARHYLDDQVVGEDEVIFMPLLICKPPAVEIDGQTVRFDTQDVQHGCHTLSFLANACAMSLVFSVLATVFFGVADVLARRGSSRIPGTVVGMGLFLVFILLQTALVAWALGSESRFWEEYYESIFAEHYGDLGYEEIQMQGNTWLMIATGTYAVLCAVLLAIETTLMFCWPYDSSKAEDGDPSDLKQFPRPSIIGRAKSHSCRPTVEYEYPSATAMD